MQPRKFEPSVTKKIRNFHRNLKYAMIPSCFVEYKKTLIILGISIAFVIFALEVNDLNEQPGIANMQGPKDQITERLSASGQVEFVVKDSDGNIIQRIEQHNLIVNKGLDFTVGNVFANVAPTTTMKFIALGDGAGNPAAGDTALGAEFNIVPTGNSHATHPHYMRGIATITPKVSISGDTVGTVQLEKTFTILNHSSRSATNDQIEGELILADGSGVKQKITEAGIFDAATGGNMFAKIKVSGNLQVQNSDTLTVTWKINYD